MADYEVFVDLARELGADEAKIIQADSVATGDWVRWKCRFGCSGYGRSLCCPPNTPTPAETRGLLSCYNVALLIHTQRDVHEDPHPTSIVAQLERSIFLAGYYKAFALGAGPCHLCRECNLEHCVNPPEARPAMEACGIDVFQTARNNGFSIKVVKDRSCRTDRFGLVLIE